MSRLSSYSKGVVFSLVLLSALTSAAVAQIWAGPATLGVAVKNAKGAPIEGALVTLAYRDVGFGAGPVPRRTDSSGEANYTNISAGTWSLKIDHPDYLSYLATVVVRKGKKPQFLAEFLEATGAGRQTMRVKPLKNISEQRGKPVEPVRTAAASPPGEELPEAEPVASPDHGTPGRLDETAISTEAHRPDIADVKPEVSAGAAEEGTVDTGAVDEDSTESEAITSPAPPVPSAAAGEADVRGAEAIPQRSSNGEQGEISTHPTPDAIPDPGEAPSTTIATPAALHAAEPAETRPTEQVEGTRTDESGPAIEHVPTPLGEPAAAPAIEPINQQGSAEPATQPKPAAALAIPPADQPSSSPKSDTPALEGLRPPAADRRALRSYRERTCFECKPGEWSVSARAPVAPQGQAPRPSISENEIREQMDILAETHGERLANYSGPLPASLVESSQEIRNHLSGAGCRLVAIVLPSGARFKGFRFQVSDRTGSGECLGDEECSMGDARWLFNPAIARSKGATIVYSVFRNSSPAQERTATLTAYFVPPGAWIAELKSP
jgi:hypothetical protein